MTEAVAEKDVVSKDHGAGIVANESFANQKSLGKPVRTLLLGVGEGKTEMAAVSQQALKVRKIYWRGDNEDLPVPASISVERG